MLSSETTALLSLLYICRNLHNLVFFDNMYKRCKRGVLRRYE
eukprot:jgi/Antlo1/1895/66